MLYRPTSAPENPPNLKEGEWETLSMSTISWFVVSVFFLLLLLVARFLTSSLLWRPFTARFKLTKPAGSREMARSNQHHVQRDRMALKQAGEIRHHHRKLRERWDRAVLKTDELKVRVCAFLNACWMICCAHLSAFSFYLSAPWHSLSARRQKSWTKRSGLTAYTRRSSRR